SSLHSLALHDALPILRRRLAAERPDAAARAAQLLPLERLPPPGIVGAYHALGAELAPQPLVHRLLQAGWRLALPAAMRDAPLVRSEEHTSELQSRENL